VDHARLQGDAKLQLNQPKIFLQCTGNLSIVLYHCNNILVILMP